MRMPFGLNRGINPGFGRGFGPRMMMPGGWMMGLGFLVVLVFLVLVGVGLYLVLRNRPRVAATAQVAVPTQVVASAQTVAQTLAAEPVAPIPATGVSQAAATSPCSHCGQPVQAGWVACPYCGEKI